MKFNIVGFEDAFRYQEVMSSLKCISKMGKALLIPVLEIQRLIHSDFKLYAKLSNLVSQRLFEQ